MDLAVWAESWAPALPATRSPLVCIMCFLESPKRRFQSLGHIIRTCGRNGRLQRLSQSTAPDGLLDASRVRVHVRTTPGPMLGRVIGASITRAYHAKHSTLLVFHVTTRASAGRH